LRRTRFELRKAEERADCWKVIIALANLDEFHPYHPFEQDRDEARVKLLAFEWSRAQVERWASSYAASTTCGGALSLTERQVYAILDLRLYQLTGLEIDKVEKEYRGLLAVIQTFSTSSRRNPA